MYCGLRHHVLILFSLLCWSLRWWCPNRPELYFEAESIVDERPSRCGARMFRVRWAGPPTREGHLGLGEWPQVSREITGLLPSLGRTVKKVTRNRISSKTLPIFPIFLLINVVSAMKADNERESVNGLVDLCVVFRGTVVVDCIECYKCKEWVHYEYVTPKLNTINSQHVDHFYCKPCGEKYELMITWKVRRNAPKHICFPQHHGNDRHPFFPKITPTRRIQSADGRGPQNLGSIESAE